MADKEKVIKGLECCAAMSGDECSKCPYGDECLDTDLLYGIPHLASDALALLKAQEAVEPRRDAYNVRKFHCGACGEYVGFIGSDPGDPNERDNYCRNCGRAVKWK